MEAIIIFLGLWVAVSTLLGVIVYPQKGFYELKLLKLHEQVVFWAYVVSYAIVALMLGFILNGGLILAAIWLALAAIQWAVSYYTFNKTKWNIKVTFWVTVAFHIVQVAALLIYLNS